MRNGILLLCFSICLSVAAENPKPEYGPHQVGFCLGSSTGMGPGYRYWPGKFGLQLAFLPYKVDSKWNDLLDVQGYAENIFSYQHPSEGQETFISIGLTGLYAFKQYKSYTLLSYLGNHLIITENDEIYNIGGGVGISFETRVGVSLMLGYGAYDILNTLKFFPSGELGVFFRFNKK